VRMYRMMRFALFAVVLPVVLQAAAQPLSELEGKFKSLQQQLLNLQQEIQLQQQQGKSMAIAAREQQPQIRDEYMLPELTAQGIQYGDLRAKPSKRLVYWQPMKKSVDNTKEQVLQAVESRLAEVIHAGEKLGVSADELLTHLKMRNSSPQ
uniref:Uncharacterized protein n=1 Tax=Parascaris univalens TaxID=6257 RepID=A0A915B193_PARUN